MSGSENNVILKYRRPADCWVCSECDSENNMLLATCAVCGTRKESDATVIPAWSEKDDYIPPVAPTAKVAPAPATRPGRPAPAPAHPHSAAARSASPAASPYSTPPGRPGGYPGASAPRSGYGTSPKPIPPSYSSESSGSGSTLVLLLVFLILVAAVAVIAANV